MAKLPKSYIRKYGISKKAWAEYRKARGKGRKKKRRRRRNLSQSTRTGRYVKGNRGPVRCRTYKTKRKATGNRRGWKC